MRERLGSFELSREIARGRDSVVLAGATEKTPVAVKLLHGGSAEARAAFLRRARAAAAIEHRNVVRTLDVLESPEHAAWVMELVDGAPVAELDASRAPPSVALRIVADALAGAHEAHRKAGSAVGLDADRVMLTRDGRVKVLLSRLGDAGDPRADLASAGRLLRGLLDMTAAPREVRALVEKMGPDGPFATAHALRVAVEQCALGLRPAATPEALATLARRRHGVPSLAPAEELEPTRRYPSATNAGAGGHDAPQGASALGEDLDFDIDAAFEAAITPPAPAVIAPPPPLAARPREAVDVAPPLVRAGPVDERFAPALPLPLPLPDVHERHATEGAPKKESERPEEHAEEIVAAPAQLRALPLPSRPAKPAQPAARVREGGFWPSLRHRNFAVLMACFLIANSGARMQTATLTWLIFKKTNDPLFLGWLGLSFALPMILLAPIGGILADRVERVRLTRIVKALAAVLSVGLVFVNRGRMLGVGPILATQALSAVLLAVEHPTRLSLVPDYVPRQHVQNAVAVNGIVNFATVFAGPALTGWLLEPFGADLVFVASAVASVLGIGLLYFVSASPPRVARSEKLRELFFGGLKHVRGDAPVVSLLILAAIVGVSARTYPELLPMFAQRSWGAGAKGYSTLASAHGIGGTLSVVALAFAPNLKGKAGILVGSVACLCVSLAAFTMMPTLKMGAAVLILSGASATVFQNIGTNFIAARVPPAVLGRVLGLYTITLFGVPGFGMIAVTAVARRTSGQTAMVCAVLVSFVALLVTAFSLTRRTPPPTRR